MWAWKKSTAWPRRPTGRARATPATMAEIVRLGEAFSIVTEHTSFLVLENDGEYQRWKIERKNALRIDRDRGASGPAATASSRSCAKKPAPSSGPRPSRSSPATCAKRFPSATSGPAPAAAPARGFDVDLGGGKQRRRQPKRSGWWRRRARRESGFADGPLRRDPGLAPLLHLAIRSRPQIRRRVRLLHRGSLSKGSNGVHFFQCRGAHRRPAFFRPRRALLFSSPEWTAACELRPGAPLAEPWRLLTGHFTHWTADHLQLGPAGVRGPGLAVPAAAAGFAALLRRRSW